jgi:hypothetical protein
MVKLLQMAETGEGTEPLQVNFNDNKGETTEFGSALNMYHNEVTGERVQMCWIQPHTVFPTYKHAQVEKKCLSTMDL